MGILNALKKASHGSFGLISRNWAYTYLRLHQLYKDVFASPESIIIGASVINGNTYLLNQQMSMDDLYFSLDHAMLGQCSITPSMPNIQGVFAPIIHGNASGFHPNGEAEFELMLNYCVQYSGLLLAIDTPNMDSNRVMETMATSAKPKIHESLEILFQELRYGKAKLRMLNFAIAGAMEMNPSNRATKYLLELMTK